MPSDNLSILPTTETLVSQNIPILTYSNVHKLRQKNTTFKSFNSEYHNKCGDVIFPDLTQQARLLLA